MKPLITICIHSQKIDKKLSHLIRSIRKQSFKEWELLIFTNEEEMENAYRVKTDERLRWYPLLTPQSLEDWRHFLFKQSKGEFILNLSPFGEMDPYTLSSAADILKANNEDVLLSLEPASFSITEGMNIPHLDPWLETRIRIASGWTPLSIVFWRRNLIKMMEPESLLRSILELPADVKIKFHSKMLCHSSSIEKGLEMEGIWPMKKIQAANYLKKAGILHRFAFDNQSYMIRPRENQSEPMASPLVSIISSLYNEEERINLMLESLELQTYKNVEIILVNDGSTDRTDLLASHFAKNSEKNVRYINLYENKGKGYCLNLALHAAQGKYLLEVDGDDWLDPDGVEFYVRCMEKMGPEIGYVYGDRRVFRPGIRQNPRFSRVSMGYPVKDSLSFLAELRPHGPRFLRTEAIRKIGGWRTDDPSQGRLYEDFIMLLRLIDQYQFIYIPGAFYNMYRTGRNRNKPFWPIMLPIINDSLQRWGIQEEYTIDYETKKIVFYSGL
jgi:glycosyltransferase involved in cell wall biosynthesis